MRRVGSLPDKSQFMWHQARTLARSFSPSTAPRMVIACFVGKFGIELKVSARRVSALGRAFVSPEPGAPLATMDKDAPRGPWLSDRKTARRGAPIPSRWHLHFGRRLVDTPNDFGRMGSPRPIPEMLEWLERAHLGRRGGSITELDRQIVTSAVYRQSSRHETRCCEGRRRQSLHWRIERVGWKPNHPRCRARLSDMLDQRRVVPSQNNFIQDPGIHVTPNVDMPVSIQIIRATIAAAYIVFLFRT